MTDKNATRALVSFIRSFTDLQEKHLRGIHNTMRETVDGVMSGIQQISDHTATNKRKANEVLVSTYTNPDDDAKRAMADVQDEVDKVLAAASAPATGGGTGGEDLAQKVRRSSGFFSKHMEALETLDSQLQETLLGMMGQLSRDDVIAQRIEHVLMALHGLQTNLTFILTDFETRCKDGDVDRFIDELKAYAFRTYTMEEEKKAFYEVFPEAKKSKAG